MSILLLSQFLHDTNHKNNLGRPVALGASGAPSGLFYESWEMARAARDGGESSKNHQIDGVDEIWRLGLAHPRYLLHTNLSTFHPRQMRNRYANIGLSDVCR